MAKRFIGSLLLATSSSLLMAAPFVYIPQPLNNQISVFDLSTDITRSSSAREEGKPVKITNLTVQRNPIAVAPNLSGTLVYVVNHDSNSITIINSSNNSVLQSFAVGSQPVAAVVSRSDQKLYVANEGENTLQVIDTNNNAIIKTIKLNSRPSKMLLTTDGRLYVLSREGKNIQAFDTTTDQALFNLATETSYVSNGTTLTSGAPVALTTNEFSGAISLYVAAEDGDIYIWDVTKPNNLAAQAKITVKPSANQVKREIRALDSSFMTLYAGLNDGDVAVIGTTSPKPENQGTITTNTSPTGITVSNDAKTVTVTNSRDNSVAVISTADNKISYIDIGGISSANGKFVGAPSFQVVKATQSQEEDNNTYAWNVVKLQIKRVGNIDGIAKVHYQTESGSAFTKWDFLETKGDLEFQKGEDTKEITIQVIGDTTVEDNENFYLKLNTPADGYNIGPQSSTEITLVNDDSLPRGAGCTIGNGNDVDPLLPLLSSSALASLMIRRRKQAYRC